MIGETCEIWYVAKNVTKGQTHSVVKE